MLIAPALADTTFGDWTHAVMPAFRHLVARDPLLAPQRIAMLAPQLAARANNRSEWWSLLRWAATISAVLAPDAPAQFMIVCDTLLRVCDEIPVGGYRALHALERLPALQAALGRLLPTQPYRVLRLLDRLGGLLALTPHAIAALQELPCGEAIWCASDRPGWHELLALAPQASADAAGYLYDGWRLGAPLDLPAGVARALAQPQRMAAERDHLAQLPGRATGGEIGGTPRQSGALSRR
ncbi:MAG: hypothetical protein HC822_20990 [Oscillochloris sp.]|nr:hypothetical protein [Oscillochloris sp.]